MSTTLQIRESKDLIVATPLDQNPAAVYLASLAKGSRRTMAQALNEIAAMLTNGQADAFAVNWGALRFQHTNAIRSKLAEKYAAATANKMLSALRGTLDAAFNLGQINAEDYLRAKSLKAIKGNSLPKGRALSNKEIDALLKTCASGKNSDIRDGAMLSMLYSCGLRRAEICALDLADYNPNDGSLVIRRGKGNKARTVFVADGAKKWLESWLNVRGSEDSALFVPVLKSGKITMRRIVPQTIFDILSRRASEAQIKDVSPHDFRRTMISQLLEEGIDISTVQRIAGHSNVATTQRYDRRGEAVKAEAVKVLRVPYFGRLGK
jgi:integrase/recombinase XerD